MVHNRIILTKKIFFYNVFYFGTLRYEEIKQNIGKNNTIPTLNY